MAGNPWHQVDNTGHERYQGRLALVIHGRMPREFEDLDEEKNKENRVSPAIPGPLAPAMMGKGDLGQDRT